jgi:parvulin-like peptidyl-prolyl isomerase
MNARVLTLGLLLGLAVVRSPVPGAEVVATLGERRVTRRELFREMAKDAGKAALDRLVGKMLLEAEIERRGIEIAPGRIQEAYRSQLAEFRQRAGEEADLAAALQRQYGMTPEEYRDEVIRFDLALEELLKQDLAPDDGDAFQFYFRHRDRYAQPEQVRLSSLLVDPSAVPTEAPPEHRFATPEQWEKARAIAHHLQRKIREAGAFEPVAGEAREELAPVTEAGEVGWLSRDSGVTEAIVETVFALGDGEVSEPVKTVNGYYILMRHEHRPARIQPYPRVKETVRRDYLAFLKQTQIDGLVRRLRRRAEADGRLRVYLEFD